MVDEKQPRKPRATRGNPRESKPKPKDQFEFTRNLEHVCRYCGWGREHHSEHPNAEGKFVCWEEFDPPYATLNDEFCNAH